MIRKYFQKYIGTREGFNLFHNEVMNMPRDEHSNLNLSKLQSLAAYLLTISTELYNKELNYKEILIHLHEQYKKGVYPLEKYRDIDFENRYLNFNLNDFDNHYNNEGRMFRHNMGFSLFFGLLESVSKQKVKINIQKCKEYINAFNDVEKELIRNEILSVNIKNNSFIKRLSAINLNEDADYFPAQGIINYIRKINRPVTAFELSILLGRIDNMQTSEEILSRALNIGKTFPSFIIHEQIQYFFESMNWINYDGSLYRYRTSQEPHFKFKSFLNFLVDFEILNHNVNLNTYTLTNYANELAKDELPFELSDLEELLIKIERLEIGDSKLKDIILIEKRESMLEYLKNDPEFIIRLGKRSLRKQELNKNNKRIRNPLIIEFAKIINNYKCHVMTWVDKDGILQHDFNRSLFLNNKNEFYCEGHHIIEFSNENGPDIIENILLVDPNTHMLIHHGHKDYRKGLFQMLREKGIINFDLFRSMIINYNCLTYEHIELLKQKSIILRNEADKLKQLIEKNKKSNIV